MRAILSMAAAMAMVATTASAQFEIEDSTTASQEVTLELINTIRGGDLGRGTDRGVHEFGVKYGALEGWQPTLSFLLINRVGDSMTVGGFRFGSTVGILGGEVSNSAFSLGLYSEVYYDFNNADARSVSVGPAIGYDQPNWSVALNAFATIPLNDGDVGFRYAVGGSYDVTEMIAIGAEAYGTISSVFDDPDIDRDEHVAGPTVRLAFDADGRDVALRVGSFFGLTDASPLVAVSANLELGF